MTVNGPMTRSDRVVVGAAGLVAFAAALIAGQSFWGLAPNRAKGLPQANIEISNCPGTSGLPIGGYARWGRRSDITSRR